MFLPPGGSFYLPPFPSSASLPHPRARHR
uniref:Uncharacterized protein n=1 Tax=Anguilla anguilla TaxID=7936 RepID=A0A0E9SAC5_ANGAN